MPTITTASIITKAQTILQDTTGVRWPTLELLGWLNDGQREVAFYKPNAHVKGAGVKLVAGTRQDLPADGIQLIDVVRNLGSTGAAPGRAIRMVVREILDAQLPGWHYERPNAEVVHYSYSMLDPKAYYVYPPQPAANQNYVELVYGASPPDATEGGAITIDDTYQTALLDYVLYRAYLKDAEYAADSGRAQHHQQAFIGALTGKAKVEALANPNAGAPMNPNVTPNSR